LRIPKFCAIFLILTWLLCLSPSPAYSKFRLKLPIKLKIPVGINVTTGAQPVAGSQDASLKMCRVEGKKGQNTTSVIGKKVSVEPVSWKGEEINSPQEKLVITDDKELQATELSFSPVGRSSSDEKKAPPSEEKGAAQVPVTPGRAVDFSKVVQSEPSVPRQSCDVSYVPGLVSKINDDMFNHYKNSTRIISIVNLPPLRSDTPSYDPREDEVIICYRGFQMTKRAARCFTKLEELIAQNLPGRRLIITSTTGGKHLDPKHYQGKAIDFVVTGLTAHESLLVESLAKQVEFMPYNEYINSSTYKTGDHMHVDSR